MKKFEHRAVLFDVTRGRVPKLVYLKKVIGLLAEYGINQVQLYMEHTFKYSFFEGSAIDFDQFEGYDADDIKDLDDYCYSLGIQLIPCIATFGHLFEILQSDTFGHLSELPKIEGRVYSWMDRQLHHTIDCSNPKSLDLIGMMVAEITACYRSPYLNICGDETYDIGKGKGRKHVQEVGQTQAYIDFLNQILEVVRAHGKTPMYWGDVIIKHPDKMHHIDSQAIPMHWWYEESVDEDEFALLKGLDREFYTCPATVGWNHFVNHYERSLINMDKMLEYGKAYGAVGGLVTDWGDFGHVNHLAMSIPMMVYGAMRMSDMDRDMSDWYTEIMEEEFYHLVYRAGNLRLVTFETIMKWYYEVFNDDHAYGGSEEELTSMSFESIVDALEAVAKLHKELERLKVTYVHELGPTKSEVANSLMGLKWMLQLVWFVKDQVYQQKTSHYMECKQLDLDILKWYEVFKVLWLKNNRRSELYRVEEVVENICAYIQKVR